MSRLRGFRERRSQWGLRRALHWQCMNTLARFGGLRLSYLFLGSGSGRWERMEQMDVPEGYEVRMVGLSDLRPFANSVADLSIDFLESAFSRKDICVASFFKGDLVGFSFRATQRAVLSEQLDIIIPEGFRYTYKTWINPDHRRRNLSQVQGYIRNRATQKDVGARGIWFVETHNYASRLHSYRHPRDRPINMGFIGWIALFGREFPITSRTARWLGVEVVRRDDVRHRHYG